MKNIIVIIALLINAGCTPRNSKQSYAVFKTINGLQVDEKVHFYGKGSSDGCVNHTIIPIPIRYKLEKNNFTIYLVNYQREANVSPYFIGIVGKNGKQLFIN
jgi:hypothetical protein